MLKNQKSKLGRQEKQAVPRLLSKMLRKKNEKKVKDNEPDLKHKIVKLFTGIGKQQIGKQELKWILLSLYYSRQQTQPLLRDALKSKADGSEQFTISQVYALCQQYPPTNKWRKQCFERFTKNKKVITLMDFEGVWDSINKIHQSGISHQSLVEIVKCYGLEMDGSLTFLEFDNLLKESNPFN